MRSIILAIDVGSSAIGCTGYEYNGIEPAKPVNGVSNTIPVSTVIASTGNIRIHEVLAAIDNCIDNTLQLLRLHMPDPCYQVIAIGFTSFMMNLVAVDIHGDPVGEAATCSDMCDREEVVLECQHLREHLGREKMNAMQRRTGAPIHASYSLPQLRAFYGNEKNKIIANQIEKWQTISSICHFRWSGRPHVQVPISISEASWTGMLNCGTCCWDDEAVDLLETCPGIAQYQFEVEDDGEEILDDIDLLPPTAPWDAALPILRMGIPQHNDDGSVNMYWGRWPELRSFPVQLFFGVSNRGSIIAGDGVVMSTPSLVQTSDLCSIQGTRCVSPHEQEGLTNGAHHGVVTMIAASLQKEWRRESASAR